MISKIKRSQKVDVNTLIKQCSKEIKNLEGIGGFYGITCRIKDIEKEILESMAKNLKDNSFDEAVYNNLVCKLRKLKSDFYKKVIEILKKKYVGQKKVDTNMLDELKKSMDIVECPEKYKYELHKLIHGFLEGLVNELRINIRNLYQIDVDAYFHKIKKYSKLVPNGKTYVIEAYKVYIYNCFDCIGNTINNDPMNIGWLLHHINKIRWFIEKYKLYYDDEIKKKLENFELEIFKLVRKWLSEELCDIIDLDVCYWDFIYFLESVNIDKETKKQIKQQYFQLFFKYMRKKENYDIYLSTFLSFLLSFKELPKEIKNDVSKFLTKAVDHTLRRYHEFTINDSKVRFYLFKKLMKAYTRYSLNKTQLHINKRLKHLEEKVEEYSDYVENVIGKWFYYDNKFIEYYDNFQGYYNIYNKYLEIISKIKKREQITESDIEFIKNYDGKERDMDNIISNIEYNYSEMCHYLNRLLECLDELKNVDISIDRYENRINELTNMLKTCESQYVIVVPRRRIVLNIF